jgi:hypothetical protein
VRLLLPEPDWDVGGERGREAASRRGALREEAERD